jgi:hypothetical protein
MLGPAAVVALAMLQVQSHWPPIAPVDTLFNVEAGTHPHVKTFVRSPNGKPLYLFICRDADDPAVGNVNYAGDLDCHLLPADRGEVEENLLVERHDVAAWYSRGRMFTSQLRGACAAYPEYGLTRHFRLRGMQITMEFKDTTFSLTGELRSYVLRFAVMPDSTAHRDIAENSGYLDPERRAPGRSCTTVQRGNEWGQ